jgi:uncharacterized protein YacL
LLLLEIVTLRTNSERASSESSMVRTQKDELILDGSVLADARIVDLAASGLIDQRVVLPRFVLNEVFLQSEGNEEIAHKAKRALEVVKKLEQISTFGMRIEEMDVPEVKDLMGKLIRLARQRNAMLVTADISRIQMSTLDGVRVVNIHALSNALKPLMQAGERMKMKIQRVGKEPMQGVGYLEDGTMVVVNGGGEFVGETIEVLVLSVKHTTAGRMVFCNALDQPAYEVNGNR